MDTIIVIIAVVVAAVFLLRTYYRSTTGQGGACNCGTCPHAKSCDTVTKRESAGGERTGRSD